MRLFSERALISVGCKGSAGTLHCLSRLRTRIPFARLLLLLLLEPCFRISALLLCPARSCHAMPGRKPCSIPILQLLPFMSSPALCLTLARDWRQMLNLTQVHSTHAPRHESVLGAGPSSQSACHLLSWQCPVCACLAPTLRSVLSQIIMQTQSPGRARQGRYVR